jgi:hypothetical protein
VFALSPPSAGQIAWTEIIIHRFRGEALGGTSIPLGGVTMGAGGVLYGTTAGNYNIKGGYGAVFALEPPAAGENPLGRSECCTAPTTTQTAIRLYRHCAWMARVICLERPRKAARTAPALFSSWFGPGSARPDGATGSAFLREAS